MVFNVSFVALTAFEVDLLICCIFSFRYLAGTGLVAGAAGFPQLQVWYDTFFPGVHTF